MIIDRSTAVPSYAAQVALWLSYPQASLAINNAHICWAQTGVQFDESPGWYDNDAVSSSAFENVNTGLYINVPNGTVAISGSTICNFYLTVTCPHGSYTGDLTWDCGVVSTPMVNNSALDSSRDGRTSQTECSFVLNPLAGTIMAAFFDTRLSIYRLGGFISGIVPRSISWSVSQDAGGSFTEYGGLPPTSSIPATQGDGGDPVMAFDRGNGSEGTIYILGNPSRDAANWKGFRLWASTDGWSFAQRNMNSPSWMNNADKPAIAVNTYSSASQKPLYIAGTGSGGYGQQIYIACSLNSGQSWDGPSWSGSWSTFPENRGADIAITPNQTVYVFWLASSSQTPPANNAIAYVYLQQGSTTWQGPLNVYAHSTPYLYSTQLNGSGDPKRTTPPVDSYDYFFSNGFPRIAANPVSGSVYLVFADLPAADPNNTNPDRGDIWAVEGTPTQNGWLGFPFPRRVNSDNTPSDQWNPSVAVNNSGTELFIGYYSRQDDLNNSLIKPYGVRARLANGLAQATFNAFPIRNTAFPPFFPGSQISTPPGNTWMYDWVWMQTNVCINVTTGMPDGVWPNCGNWADNNGSMYQNFCADDYTWSQADDNYFYFAWCDRSDTYTTWDNHTRNDPNIRFAKIKP